MAYEQREGQGSLFRNDKRESDRHPNAKGSALIGGVEYWVSSWTNEAKSGDKYQSLKFSRKDESKAPDPYKGMKPEGEFNDDIPW